MMVDFPRDRMDTYVDDVVERLDLVAYIRRFNEPGGGKICSFSDFLVAADLKKGLGEAYEAARDSAPGTTDIFDEAVRARLEPVIISTVILVVPEECRIWAAEVATDQPDNHEAPAPFADADGWVDWVMGNVDEPCTICGPYGEDVLERETQDLLLRRSLRAELPSAIRNGWLREPNIIRLADRQDPNPAS